MKPRFSHHSCCLPYTVSLVVHILTDYRSTHTRHIIVYSISISQGSAATHLRCGGNFNNLHCEFSDESASERLWKIAHSLAKIWHIIEVIVFLWNKVCMYMCFCPYLCQIQFFTGALCSKLATKWSSIIPPHSTYVAALLREIIISENSMSCMLGQCLLQDECAW